MSKDTYTSFNGSYDAVGETGTALLDAPVETTRLDTDKMILDKIHESVTEDLTLARDYVQTSGE